jgi:hypothetical protein
LPFGVKGSVGSGTKAAGIMYSGNFCLRKSRNSSEDTAGSREETT